MNKHKCGDYRDAAKRLHHKEGKIEVDDTATVSTSADGGAYVAAWVWVRDEDVKPEDKKP